MMKNNQRIYYAIAGLTIFFAWLVATSQVLNFQATHLFANSIFHNLWSAAYKYFINWKLFSFLCLLVGLKASAFSNDTDLKLVVTQSISYMLLSFGLAFKNAATLSFLPIAIFYLILFAYRHKSRFYIASSILLFVILAAFLSMLTATNNFFETCFYELTSTHLNINNLEQTFRLMLKSNQLFGFSYGISILFMGYWIGKAKWFKEYHFFYNELKYLFKLSVGLLCLWIILNYFNVYQYISHWKIGRFFFFLDGYTVQILTLFIYIFILIYLENFKWGLKILRLLEYAGRSWIIQVVFIFLFIIIFQFVNMQIPPSLILIFAMILFILLTKLYMLYQFKPSKEN